MGLNIIDETAWKRKEGSLTHWLLIMGWDMIGVTAWPRNVTHCPLLVMEWLMWLPKKKKYSVIHPLLIMGWDMIDVTPVAA